MRKTLGVIAILIALCVGLERAQNLDHAMFTEGDFRGQQESYAEQADSDGGVFAAIATSGYSAVGSMLNQVQGVEHEDETEIGCSIVLLVFGIWLFRKKRAARTEILTAPDAELTPGP